MNLNSNRGIPTLPAMPVGSVIAYAGIIAPSGSNPTPGEGINIEAYGWLVCDGKPQDVEKYPELFQSIDFLYGGSGNTFNVPDFRGQFLRMVDLSSQKDPDAGSRIGGDKATGVGSSQECALQEHVHDYDEPSNTEVAANDGMATTTGMVKKATSNPTDKAVTSPNETRPVNAAIYYIIKAF